MAAIVDGNYLANFIGYSFLPFYSKASLKNNGTFWSSVVSSCQISTFELPTRDYAAKYDLPMLRF